MKIIKTKSAKLLRFFPAAVGVIAMAACLLAMPQKAAEGVRAGLTLCAGSVIPSLFPFMVLSSFIIKSGFCRALGKRTDRLARVLFSLPGDALPAVIMGMTGGFPVGASMTAKLLKDGRLTKNQAQRMTLFCVNAGPAFVIGTVGASMLGSTAAGGIMLLSLLLSSLIIGVLTKFMSDGEYIEFSAENTRPMPLSEAFVESVADGSGAMFSVCAWVVLFSCVSGFADLLNLSEGGGILLKSVLEVTNGCSAAAGKVPLPIFCLILGWCGLSVQCQILGYTSQTGVKYSLFLCARIMNGALAAIICAALLEIFPGSVPAMSNISGAIPAPYSASIPAAAGLLITGGLLILELDSRREMC